MCYNEYVSKLIKQEIKSDMTNELGNMTYKHAVNVVREYFVGKNKGTDLDDFIVDSLAEMKIYNLSEVYCRLNKNFEAGKLNRISNISVDKYDEHFIYKNAHLPDFPVFSYHTAESEGKKINQPVIIFMGSFPLSDNRWIAFTGGWHARGGKAVLTSLMQCGQVLGDLKVKIAGNENLAKAEFDMLQESMSARVEIYLDTFLALEKQEERNYRCFIDNMDKPRVNVYISRGDKQTVKILDKPVYLILRDDDLIDTNIKRYRRKGGTIQYCFSWIVRGHWRKLHNPETFGYGLTGERVQGKTYIKSYVKGDKNAPLIKRETHIVDRRKRA